jgi:hypothetical protein
MNKNYYVNFINSLPQNLQPAMVNQNISQILSYTVGRSWVLQGYRGPKEFVA